MKPIRKEISVAVADAETHIRIEAEIGASELKRLRGFAYGIAKRYGWRRGIDALPRGGTPEDIVSEAIEKTIRRGKHSYTWNREANPDIFEHLLYVIRDILKNRYRRKERELSAGRIEPWDMEKRGPQVDGEEEMQREREERRAREHIEALKSAVKNRDDPLMEDVLDGLLDGELKRADIAEILEVELSDYDNAYKRLIRLGGNVLADGRSS